MKAFFRSKIEAVRDDYLKDLEAMSPELLARKPSDDARSAFDFTYEVVLVNERIVCRLKGEEPGPWPGADGFLTAPEDWQNKDKAIAEFKQSMEALLKAWENLTGDQIAATEGERSPIEMAYFACQHLLYHDGQLNFIQSLAGDKAVHW